MAQRKKTQLGGKKCSKFTHKISKQSTDFTLLFFLTRLENRYSCKYILHCSSLIWFRTAFTLFNSGKQFLIITSKPFKTVISNGLEQIPFLVRTISDCSFGLQSLSLISLELFSLTQTLTGSKPGQVENREDH